MDYFDDDELINDYMEDDGGFEPPQEDEDADFPEDFILAEQLVKAQQQTHTLAASNTPINDNNDFNTATPMAVQIPTQNRTVAATASLPTEIHLQPGNSRRSDRDLYSFERYTASNPWRQTRNEEAFEVRHWNRTHTESSLAHRARARSSARASTFHKKVGPLLCSSVFQPLETIRVSVINNTSNTNSNTKSKHHGVTKFPTEGQASVEMTASGGTRVHVATNHGANLKGQRTLQSTVYPCNNNTKKDASNSLLGVSMATLMARSDTLARKHPIVRRSRPLRPQSDSQLWVDKHAPNAFSHLLSDEQTNRNVLRALRAWDPYVFHKDAPKPRFTTNNNNSDGTATPHNPLDSRPMESNRVLLLSGPPGVGKTTLAHIIARHAGYHPLEVNASDDRSAQILSDKVIRAMESSTLTKDLTLDGKPNCIILDEVDGADAKSAIAALVAIIRAEIPAKGSKQKQHFLRRPIIFICNHKYSPALRPLLPYCMHFDVDPPSDQRLVARLRAILAKERLSSNASSLLNNLVVASGGDIRSCLFTLQFAAAKARSNSTLNGHVVDISSTLKGALSGDGLKDTRTDLATTAAIVFQKPKGQNDSRTPSSTQKVLSVVESFGDDTKTLECLFANLLQVSYIDPTMERCLLAHEWLSGGVDMSSLSSPAAAAVHVLCRIETSTNLVLSNKESSHAHFQRESNLGILQKFVDGLLQCSSNTAITETVPFALWMLSAADSLHRPVSSMDILSHKERQAFRAHVSTLRCLGLTYLASGLSKNFVPLDVTSTVEMRLEPEIDRLVDFKGFRASIGHRRQRVPSVLRQLLAHEARMELIRDREKRSKVATLPPTTPIYPRHQIPSISESTEAQCEVDDLTIATPPFKKIKVEPALKNFLGLGAQRAKASRTARKKALVGFNNRVRAEKLTHTGSGVPLTQVVRFKYQKGFTQAVRTVCRMEDLL